MDYLVGDLQGCGSALERLLDEIGFSASRDRLFVLGDLVNRGPASLATLQRLRGLGHAATCLLGNHDLHLLAVSLGVRKPGRKDTLGDILAAPDREAWIDWLRQRRMAVFEHGWLMVHAGVAPAWDRDTTLRIGGEVEQRLRAADWGDFMREMYGDAPARWSEDLHGNDRLRFAVNALTRMRFVRADDGSLDFSAKDGSSAPPPGLVPWFEAPGRRTAGVPVAFGHWSTLGLINRPDLLSLDTGCVWGGKLSAMRVDGGRRELVQVACDQAQKPG